MATKSNNLTKNIKEHLREQHTKKSAAHEWDGWVAKVTLEKMDAQYYNEFDEFISGPSYDVQDPKTRKRIVLITKIDFAIPPKISPRSGLLCFSTTPNLKKVTWHCTPDTKLPYYQVITELHCGLSLSWDDLRRVGIGVEYWKFAIMDELIALCVLNSQQMAPTDFCIRDQDGYEWKCKDSNDIRKLFNRPSDERLAKDVQRVVREESEGKKVRPKYPNFRGVRVTHAYASLLFDLYNINILPLATEGDGYVYGLFYLQSDCYVQYINGPCGISMYLEGPPNLALDETMYGHQSYATMCSRDQARVFESRKIFEGALLKPEYLRYFEPFTKTQQRIIGMYTCLNGDQCCHLRAHDNCKLGDACCIDSCIDHDIYIQLLHEWDQIYSKILKEDYHIYQIRKTFRKRPRAKVAAKCTARLICSTLDDSDGINNIDAVLALMHRLANSMNNSSEDGSKDELNDRIHLPLPIIIEKLLEWFDKDDIDMICAKHADEQIPKERIKKIGKSLLDYRIIHVSKIEFKKFHHKYRNATIDGKPLEPEFWNTWQLSLLSNDPFTEYVRYVKYIQQSYYQNKACDKSKKYYDGLCKMYEISFGRYNNTTLQNASDLYRKFRHHCAEYRAARYTDEQYEHRQMIAYLADKLRPVLEQVAQEFSMWGDVERINRFYGITDCDLEEYGL